MCEKEDKEKFVCKTFARFAKITDGDRKTTNGDKLFLKYCNTNRVMVYYRREVYCGRGTASMLNFAVVEDEDSAADTLTGYIRKYCAANNIQSNVIRFASAAEMLKNYKPVYDVIFMDIMLPNLNGMEAAKRLRNLDGEVVLIFVTNMANFAVKGYEVDALDFIIKPVVYDSFVMKMKKAVNVAYRSRSVGVKIQMDGSIKLIAASKIYYIEVSRHNLVYHTEEGDFNERGTLSGLAKQLAGENFVLCNVCFLVNLKYVTEIIGDNVTVAGHTLKISRARKKEFLQSLTNFLGRSV